MNNPRKQAIIALGSNLGDSINILKQALQDIANIPDTILIRCSSFYKTTPVGYLEQADFVNAVCEISTTLTPQLLLKGLQLIEKKHKRIRSIKNGPRTLDLDLIDFSQQTINSPHLTLPHPRAHERGFVMIPLAEILPNYIFNEKIATKWKQQLGQDGVQLMTI